jgi:hypothetical protein
MSEPEFTAEDQQRLYTASLDSVSLINQLVAEGDASNEDDVDTMGRNVRHLEGVVAANITWTVEQDLTPFNEAIAAGRAWMPAE